MGVQAPTPVSGSGFLSRSCLVLRPDEVTTVRHAIMEDGENALILKNVGALLQTMYSVATALGLTPCALGVGDIEEFGKA